MSVDKTCRINRIPGNVNGSHVPRLTGRSRPIGADKVHPFFVKLAGQHKKIVQLSRSGSEEDRQESQRLIRNPPPEMVEEAQRVGDEFRRSGKKIDVLFRRFSGSMIASQQHLKYPTRTTCWHGSRGIAMEKL